MRKLLDVVIGLAIAFLVSAPLAALMIAWGAGSIWDLFIAEQYGAGPNGAAWYGASLLVSLMTIGIKRELVKSDEDSSVIAIAVVSLMFTAISVLLVVGFGHVVKWAVW